MPPTSRNVPPSVWRLSRMLAFASAMSSNTRRLSASSVVPAGVIRILPPTRRNSCSSSSSSSSRIWRLTADCDRCSWWPAAVNEPVSATARRISSCLRSTRGDCKRTGDRLSGSKAYGCRACKSARTFVPASEPSCQPSHPANLSNPRTTRCYCPVHALGHRRLRIGVRSQERPGAPEGDGLVARRRDAARPREGRGLRRAPRRTHRARDRRRAHRRSGRRRGLHRHAARQPPPIWRSRSRRAGKPCLVEKPMALQPSSKRLDDGARRSATRACRCGSPTTGARCPASCSSGGSSRRVPSVGSPRSHVQITRPLAAGEVLGDWRFVPEIVGRRPLLRPGVALPSTSWTSWSDRSPTSPALPSTPAAPTPPRT